MPSDAPTSDDIVSLGTKTHQTSDGAKEVATVTVPAEYVGNDRTAAPNPYSADFDHEMRCAYHLTGSRVGVQFPRWSNEFRKFEVKAPLSDIVTDDLGTVRAFYTLEGAVLVVTWDVSRDKWTWEEQEVEDYDEYVEDAESLIWSAVRKTEQVL